MRHAGKIHGRERHRTVDIALTRDDANFNGRSQLPAAGSSLCPLRRDSIYKASYQGCFLIAFKTRLGDCDL